MHQVSSRTFSKSKVERPTGYLRDSFFYWHAFANDEDLSEQAWRWVGGTANVRRQGTICKCPVDGFERKGLRPLASRGTPPNGGVPERPRAD